MVEPKLIQYHDHIYGRGHTKRFDSSRMLTALAGRRISVVINVAPSPDDILAAGARTIGMDYRHRPLPDGKNVPVAEIDELVSDVVRIVEEGRSVLVHCNAGRNRSGVIIVLAIARLTGRDVMDVLAEAREVRPGLIGNPVFEEFLSGRSRVAVEDDLRLPKVPRRPDGAHLAELREEGEEEEEGEEGGP